MITRLDSYFTRIQNNIKNRSISNDSHELILYLNQLITNKTLDKLPKRGSYFELSNFSDNDTFHKLNDADYRDILEKLDKKFHKELYSLGIKTVSKYSLFGNERATEKIFALQNFYYEQVFEDNNYNENIINQALDFYQNICLFDNFSVIKTYQNKTFSNIRNFLINKLNEFENKLSRCFEKPEFNVYKSKIMGLALDARSLLMADFNGFNNFKDLKNFIKSYLKDFNNSMDTKSSLSKKIYDYIFTGINEYDLKDIDDNFIKFIYTYETKILNPDNQYKVLNIIIKKIILKNDQFLLSCISKLNFVNDVNEILAAKFLICHQELTKEQIKKAIVFILNLLKNENVSNNNVNNSYKLISLLLNQKINDIEGLYIYIDSLQCTDQLAKNKTLIMEKMNYFEELCDKYSKLNLEIDKLANDEKNIIKNQLDPVLEENSNNEKFLLPKTQDLLSREADIRKDLDEIGLNKKNKKESLSKIFEEIFNKEILEAINMEQLYYPGLNKLNTNISFLKSDIQEIKKKIGNKDIEKIRSTLELLKEIQLIDVNSHSQLNCAHCRQPDLNWK
jgi:hypothetical protein